MGEALTPVQRVLTALSHREPDRVPVFLLLTMHGAKELGMSLPEYYKAPSNLAEAQIRMADKFGHDCLYAFLHAAGEAAAFGSEIIFYDDGPPNAGEPVARRARDILSRPVPDPHRVPLLSQVLEAIRLLSERNRGHRPIIGVAMAPFSLPIMLLGLERWVNLLYEEPEAARDLVRHLGDFCVAWSNAQVAAGANAIAYFDPMASSTMATPEQFLAFDLEVATRTIKSIKAPCAFHFASGRCGRALQYIPDTGAAAVVVGEQEDLRAVKSLCRGRVSVMGNLNGIEMVRWTASQAEAAVKSCLMAGASGGGFVLTDQHGEIPFYVPEETLHAIMAAAHRWGSYPLGWDQETA